MTKITILTPTYKNWPVLTAQAQALQVQTFPREEIQWVIVDDLFNQRPQLRDELSGVFGGEIVHVPPRVLRKEADMCGAMNSGLIHARGDLVYFMVDYMVPQPQTLERHWALYEREGPNVITSGPLRTASLKGAEVIPGDHYLTEREGEAPGGRSVWRIPVRTDMGVKWVHQYAWMGRNDSAPLEALLAVNGFDERYVGSQGGDPELAIRLINWGCRYVLDLRRGDSEALMIQDHVNYPGYGKVRPNGLSHFEESRVTRKTWVDNGWVLMNAQIEAGREDPQKEG